MSLRLVSTRLSPGTTLDELISIDEFTKIVTLCVRAWDDLRLELVLVYQPGEKYPLEARKIEPEQARIIVDELMRLHKAKNPDDPRVELWERLIEEKWDNVVNEDIVLS